MSRTAGRVVAASAAMGTAIVALAASTAGHNDRSVWRGDGALGLNVDSLLWIVVAAVSVVAAVAVLARRSVNTEAATLRAGAAVAAALAVVLLFVDVLASRDGGDVNLQPDEVFWWMLNIGGAFAAALFLAPVLAPGLPKLARLGLTTAAFSAAFMTTWAAAFQDNSGTPTPALLSLVVLLAPLVLASAYRYTTVPAWITTAVLGAHLVGLVVVLHDAVVCHDDDCLPVSISLQLGLVATIWAASAWIANDKHADFVLKT